LIIILTNISLYVCGIKMKILFLDFDGVLNSEKYFEEWILLNPDRRGSLINQLDPKKVDLLNRIINATGANVVISSTWRILHSMEELKDILISFGFKYPQNIIDETPQTFSGYRGREINLWLTYSNESDESVDQFVIVDDNSDMEPHMNNLVQTTWKDGMQESHMIEIINRLNFQNETCTKPPPGWYCTRGYHSTGPCAAWPDKEQLEANR
jgi:histidinol phosphatase-like enzyme